MNAHSPRTPMCLFRIDSTSWLSGCDSIDPLSTVFDFLSSVVGTGKRLRVPFFTNFVRHFRLNRSSSLFVAGRKEQCKSPPRTCAAFSRTSSTKSSNKRNTMVCTCWTQASRLKTIGMLLKTSTCRTSITDNRADQEGIRDTSSIFCSATDIQSGSVRACEISANNDEQVVANSKSCSQRSNRQAIGSSSKYSAMFPFVLRLRTPVSHWHTGNGNVIPKLVWTFQEVLLSLPVLNRRTASSYSGLVFASDSSVDGPKTSVNALQF